MQPTPAQIAAATVIHAFANAVCLAIIISLAAMAFAAWMGSRK